MNNIATQLSEGTFLQNRKYRIENVLGQGGFGITYLARQQSTGQEVCVKEFFMRDFCSRSTNNYSVTLGTSANKDLLERYRNKFIKEARTISTLKHPNIIHIYDIFQENGTAYYVMDYIDGESLSEMVKHRGILPEQEAVNYIRAVGDALRYIHQRNINHLDVKPGNIMVRRSDSRVFLLDFGLSKQYDILGNQTSSTPLGISHGFAPIEQYSPEGIKEFSPQTDIYSLGATLYYLVTGTTPPPASELFSKELGGFPPTLSASIEEVVRKSMKPQKKERPQDISEFLSLLPSIKHAEKKQETEQVVDEETVFQQQSPTVSSSHESTQGNSSDNQNKTEQNQSESHKKGIRKNNYKIIGCIAGIAAAIFLYVLLFGESADELYQKGKQALEQKDYTTAFSLLKKAAEKDHVEAQFELGILYSNGKGVTQDFTKAAKWYQKAAEQGNADAQWQLGEMYSDGKGVSRNLEEAEIWYVKAAEQGEEYIQGQLADKFSKGDGVYQNYEKAEYWYEKEAEQGEYYTKSVLGRMYSEGDGVRKNWVKAEKWLIKAAEQGGAGQKFYLGSCYELGEGLKQDYTKAAKWYRIAAEQGNASAQARLGDLYCEGKGVPQDYSEAMTWYRAAAAQGSASAQVSLIQKQ